MEKMEPPGLGLGGGLLTLSGSASNRRSDKRKQIRYQRLRGRQRAASVPDRSFLSQVGRTTYIATFCEAKKAKLYR
jgi:hypothetical protein